MMNRRKIIGSLAALPIAASIPDVVKAKELVWTTTDGYMATLNKAGKVCTWSKELADDLYHLHGIRIETIFWNSYGTKFTISKDKEWTNIFQTDDVRDEIRKWDKMTTWHSCNGDFRKRFNGIV